MSGQLRILVAGASGALGRHVTNELIGRGHHVTALIHRRPLPTELGDRVDVARADALDRGQLVGLCEGIDAVFSALGASVLPDMRRGRRSFDKVDTPANLSLIDEAESAGMNRFVYVSVAGHRECGHLRYVGAHEAVVERLRKSSLSTSVIRPPGFFSAFREVLTMAGKGTVPVIGDGSARSNPIHEYDLAGLCADAVEDGSDEITLGGPEVLTRREIVELAFEVLGRPAKIRRVPPGLVRAMAPLLRPLSPRVADLTAFYAEISTRDLVVPATGTRTLREYFAEVLKENA